MFRSASNEWKYLNYRELTFLVDDQRIRLAPKQDGRVRDGYVTEVMTTQVDLEDVALLAGGKSVEGKLGSTEFRLSGLQQQAIKVYLRCFSDLTFDPNKERVAAEAEAAKVQAAAAMAKKAAEEKEAAAVLEGFARAKAKDAADIQASEKLFEEATALAKIPKTVKALEIYRKIVVYYPNTDAARRAALKIKAIQKAKK